MTDTIKTETDQSGEVYQYRGLNRSFKIPACVISISDLKRLYNELSEKSREGLERELSTYTKKDNQTNKKFEELKDEARKHGTLTVMVYGSQGEQLLAGSAESLNIQTLPENITLIIFDNSLSLKDEGLNLLNRFRLELDFTEPPSFYGYNPWEQPTPNHSSIVVIGSDTTWVAAIYEYVVSFFKSRRKHRQWLHSQTTFNLFHWLISFPGALWIVYRIDTSYQSIFQNMHATLRGAIYVYIVFLSLLFFRILAAGIRWVFPIVELENARSKKMRRLIGGVVGALLLALLYDVLKAFFSS